MLSINNGNGAAWPLKSSACDALVYVSLWMACSSAVLSLQVAFHLQPYRDRNQHSVLDNVKYIIDR